MYSVVDLVMDLPSGILYRLLQGTGPARLNACDRSSVHAYSLQTLGSRLIEGVSQGSFSFSITSSIQITRIPCPSNHREAAIDLRTLEGKEPEKIVFLNGFESPADDQRC